MINQDYISQYTGEQIDNLLNQTNNFATTADLASISVIGSTNTTGATIAKCTYFYLNGTLVQAKADIASGATFMSGTNYEDVTAGALNESVHYYNSIRQLEVSTLPTTNNFEYTCPYTGYYSFEVVSVSSTAHDMIIYIGSIDIQYAISTFYSTSKYHRCMAFAPLKQGTKVIFWGVQGDIYKVRILE